jgi:hypothetical protein
MSSGTIFWILLLIVGPPLMVFMHRGHGGHGTHGAHGSHGGGGAAGPATPPADPRTKAGDDSSRHAGHSAGRDASEQDTDGHRHRGC